MEHSVHLNIAQRKRAFVSMLIMVPLGGAVTDIYIPSLPAMVGFFHTSEFAIQSTLLVYMAFYGLGQNQPRFTTKKPARRNRRLSRHFYLLKFPEQRSHH